MVVARLARRRGVPPPIGRASVDPGSWLRSAVDVERIISIAGLR
jgi:hypothetical protein